jgi:hypothetical protein
MYYPEDSFTSTIPSISILARPDLNVSSISFLKVQQQVNYHLLTEETNYSPIDPQVMMHPHNLLTSSAVPRLNSGPKFLAHDELPLPAPHNGHQAGVGQASVTRCSSTSCGRLLSQQPWPSFGQIVSSNQDGGHTALLLAGMGCSLHANSVQDVLTAAERLR